MEPDEKREGGPAEPGEAPEPGESPDSPERELTELPGADAAELGAMLRRAAATGLPQVSTESHAVDAAGGDLAREILSILGGGGLAGAGGMREVDPEELRELHDRVREALRRRGIDPDSGTGA
jgi:hypothetical protein